MDRREFVRGGGAAFAAVALSSCVAYPVGGPPPHAPAHGHRRKHRSGADLVFDQHLGVYAVLGYPYYFHNERYYRQSKGAWQFSVNLDGPWQPQRDELLPPGLRRKGRRGPPAGRPDRKKR